MGERELQEALRDKAQERIRQLWQAAENAMSARRAEVAAEQATRRIATEQQLVAEVAVMRRNLLAAAELEARQQCLTAETLLHERLHALAGRLLAGLDAGRRQRLWLPLAAELPAADWRMIRVHPDDLAAARQRFPAVDVVADAALAGGLVAETEDGRIVADNSLAGRLERAWFELLTPLFAAIDEEVGKDAAGSAAPD